MSDDASSLGRWAPTRAGKLDAEVAGELAVAFGYAQWSQMDGSYGSDESLMDGPTLVLFDGINRIRCHAPCMKSAPVLAAGLAGLSGWISRLYDLGNDASGEIRLRVFEADNYLGGDLGKWPLVRPPSDFLNEGLDPGAVFGPATVIADEDAELLRGQRDALSKRFFKGEAAGAPHAEVNRMYAYAFRDVIRFEGADGKIPGLDWD